MVKDKGYARDKSKTKISILHSRYTFPILSNIYHGYRPSQIANKLGISAQLIKYYTDNLIDLKLIEKVGNRQGLVWRLTAQGVFILKEKLSRSVNSLNYPLPPSSYTSTIPIRMHNLTFSFDIISMDKNLRLRWQPINNGVLKCFIKYPSYTLELTKSPNGSVLEVHLSEEYVFDPLLGLLKQYDLARYYASLAAQRLRL
jgi:hypothetical protein